MNKILTSNEIAKFKTDGAVFLKGKFDKKWIEMLKKGIQKGKKNLAQDLSIILKIKIYLGIMRIFGLGIYMMSLKILFLILQHLKLQPNF